MKDKREVKNVHAEEKGHEGEVKSALEVGLERAVAWEDEPIEIETERGPVSMTFEQIKEKAGQAEEYLKALQYKQAEFENYRKRTIREREDLLKETVRLTDLFELFDPLDRALECTGDAEAIKDGIRLIKRQFLSLLERMGVEKVPGVGEPFDPSHHEAIAEQAHEEVPMGHVALEYQPGFKLGEKVLRPGKVVVSSGPLG